MKKFLGQRWFLILLLGGVGGALLFPVPASLLTAWLEPKTVVALALLCMALTMPTRNLAGELRRPWAGLWALLLSYGALPGAAYVLGQLSPWPDITVGLLLAASVPCTLASAVLWTRLAGGNEATALLTVILSTLSSWLATTLLITFLTGTSVHIPALELMGDLLLTLVVPMIVGQGAQALPALARLTQRGKFVLGVVAQVLILSIVVKASSNVGMHMAVGSSQLGAGVFLTCALLAPGLHVLALTAGFWTSRWLGFDRGRQIAVAISCSQKTLPVSLFLYERYFDEDFPLAVVPLVFYHVGQLVLDTIIADRFLRETAMTSADASLPAD